MKIVTLMENTCAREDLAWEHGLSLYIETGRHRILFDAGQTGAFADNARKLGIDLSRVDFGVLSHGHYDHGGGLRRFLEINETAPVYLSRNAFSQCYNAGKKYIGLDPALAGSHRLRYVDDGLQLEDGIWLYSGNGFTRHFPVESFGLSILRDGGFQRDDFAHEQYLLIRENGKTVCISGCSHRGILNIVRWFQPDVLVGGFHFMKLDPQTADAAFLERAAKELLSHPTVYYTGHCTGEKPFAFLKERMGDRLNTLSTGMCLSL